MNSKFIALLVLFVSTMSFAQDDDAWRDSLILARKAYQNKEYTKALKHYESAQKIAPEDIDFSDEMAQSAYRSRDFERAEKIYRQGSSTKMSKNERADAMHNLGNSQMRQKDYKAAAESYKEALRNNPNDEETRYNLSEAVRKIQEQRTPPPPPKKPNDPKDPKDPKNGNSGNNKSGDPKKGEGEQGKNNQGQNSNGKSGESKGQQNQSGSGDGGNSEEGSKGKLSNQMVERTLDKLAKKEAETKREMMGGRAGGRSAKSGKDW